MVADEWELRQLVAGNQWLTRALTVVRDSGLPDAWIGAGALRDLVWGERYGDGFDPDTVRDVDVVFFDPTRLTREDDDRATARLTAAWPQPPWEARNQAAVHIWYAAKFGGDPIAPYRGVAEAIATWPEYATAVAVRLDRGRPAGNLRAVRPRGPAGRGVAPQPGPGGCGHVPAATGPAPAGAALARRDRDRAGLIGRGQPRGGIP